MLHCLCFHFVTSSLSFMLFMSFSSFYIWFFFIISYIVYVFMNNGNCICVPLDSSVMSVYILFSIFDVVYVLFIILHFVFCGFFYILHCLCFHFDTFSFTFMSFMLFMSYLCPRPKRGDGCCFWVN